MHAHKHTAHQIESFADISPELDVLIHSKAISIYMGTGVGM
jgi:hypothetical protein